MWYCIAEYLTRLLSSPQPLIFPNASAELVHAILLLQLGGSAIALF